MFKPPLLPPKLDNCMAHTPKLTLLTRPDEIGGVGGLPPCYILVCGLATWTPIFLIQEMDGNNCGGSMSSLGAAIFTSGPDT